MSATEHQKLESDLSRLAKLLDCATRASDAVTWEVGGYNGTSAYPNEYRALADKAAWAIKDLRAALLNDVNALEARLKEFR